MRRGRWRVVVRGWRGGTLLGGMGGEVCHGGVLMVECAL